MQRNNEISLLKDAVAIFLKKNIPTHNTQVFIANSNKEAEMLFNNLQFFLPQSVKLLFFPQPDIPFFSNTSVNNIISNERIKTLSYLSTHQNLTKSDSYIIVTTPISILFKTIPTQQMSKMNLMLTQNLEMSMNNIIHTLATLGYERTEIADEIGTFSVKGDIMKIVNNTTIGLQIDMFGDIIEHIRSYSIETFDIINKNINNINILPIKENIINEKTKDNFIIKYRSAFKTEVNLENIDFCLSNPSYLSLLFEESLATLFSYISSDALIIQDVRSAEIFNNAIEEIVFINNLNKDNNNILKMEELYISSQQEIEKALNNFNRLTIKTK